MKPIVIALVRALAPELVATLRNLRKRLVARPFPTGAIIMEEISRTFPLAPQKEVYALTQHVKLEISSIEGLEALKAQAKANN